MDLRPNAAALAAGASEPWPAQKATRGKDSLYSGAGSKVKYQDLHFGALSK